MFPETVRMELSELELRARCHRRFLSCAPDLKWNRILVGASTTCPIRTAGFVRIRHSLISLYRGGISWNSPLHYQPPIQGERSRGCVLLILRLRSPSNI